MRKSGLFALIISVTLFCGAAPAMPAPDRKPAPVPGDIPVAVMVDVSTGQTLYSREAHRRFVPASITKVMTAFTAFRLIDEGDIAITMPVPISQELEDEWSGEGSSMFLKAGERPTFGELLLGATTVSGNDASVAIAVASTGSIENWIKLMNENAVELGMRNTHFGSANGYPDEGRTFTSAEDMAKLGSALVTRYPGLYRRYFGHRTLTWRGITQANHDPLTGRVAGADGIKTGYTREAGYTFIGSAERDGRRLLLVLAGSPSAQLRDTTARSFMEWGFSDFVTTRLIDAGVVIGKARIQDGGATSVDLKTAGNVAISLPVDLAANVQMSIRYHGPISAPVMEGEEIASLRISVPDQPIFEVPLQAAQTVKQANFLQRIRNGIRGLFA